jgi:hypothetical protein
MLNSIIFYKEMSVFVEIFIKNKHLLGDEYTINECFYYICNRINCLT